MRQVVLDTETTGLEPALGHRIIEIGCVEVINRRITGRHYHQYINPQREVDEGALEVHGISDEFLADKPLFAEIVDEFMAFVNGAELVIHNAPFDIGFLDHELKLHGNRYTSMRDYCGVVDSLVLARNKHPGQKNNLDALCKRYDIDNSQRDLHGALLDSEILADVYLAMTGGQTALSLGANGEDDGDETGGGVTIRRINEQRPKLKVITASPEEIKAHEDMLALISKKSGDNCLWNALESAGFADGEKQDR
jgi:DNA polymerase-3 subunit epsilon